MQSLPQGMRRYGLLAQALIVTRVIAVPAMAVYLPSEMIPSRVVTLAPCTLLGLALFVLCAKALKLLSAEDKSYLSHLLPARLQWVPPLI